VSLPLALLTVIRRDEAPCMAGATVSVSTVEAAAQPTLRKCHASAETPYEAFFCGFSKLSPNIICDEKPRTWCVNPESEWQPK